MPFVGTVLDGFDRRLGMLPGFGGSLADSARPMYAIEINHPAYRGRIEACSCFAFGMAFTYYPDTTTFLWIYYRGRNRPRWAQRPGKLPMASGHLVVSPVVA